MVDVMGSVEFGHNRVGRLIKLTTYIKTLS